MVLRNSFYQGLAAKKLKKVFFFIYSTFQSEEGNETDFVFLAESERVREKS
jgi:hypothetical protein